MVWLSIQFDSVLESFDSNSKISIEPTSLWLNHFAVIERGWSALVVPLRTTIQFVYNCECSDWNTEWECESSTIHHRLST